MQPNANISSYPKCSEYVQMDTMVHLIKKGSKRHNLQTVELSQRLQIVTKTSWVHLRCAGILQARYTDTWTCHLHRESGLTTHTDITPPHPP